MTEALRAYCYFGCGGLVCYRIPIHRFPNPQKHPILFASWMDAVGDEQLRKIDPMKVYASKRICDHHFKPEFKISTSRLVPSAVPSVNLNCVEQSLCTFVETDHSYSFLVRDCVQVKTLYDVTNKNSTVDQMEALPGSSDYKTSYDVTNINNTVDQREPSPGPSDYETLYDDTNINNTLDHRAPSPGPSAYATTPTLMYNEENTLAKQKKKAPINRIKKIRQLQNKVTRLRKINRSYKLRLEQLNNKIAVQNFDKLTQYITKSAKLFSRKQHIEEEEKQRHRFTLEEKILLLSIFNESPYAYNLIRKHFILPSKNVLKLLPSELKIYPGIDDIDFNVMKNTVSKMLREDRPCTLTFDEMCSDEILD